MVRSARTWIPLAFWAFVIFFTSCFYIPSKHFVHWMAGSSSALHNENDFNRFWHSWWWVFVKGYHCMEYFLLTWLLCRALQSKIKKPELLAWLIAIAYASSDEWHQTFVPGRGGKWTDVVIDAFGATTYIVVRVLLKKRQGIFASHGSVR